MNGCDFPSKLHTNRVVRALSFLVTTNNAWDFTSDKLATKAHRIDMCTAPMTCGLSRGVSTKTPSAKTACCDFFSRRTTSLQSIHHSASFHRPGASASFLHTSPSANVRGCGPSRSWKLKQPQAHACRPPRAGRHKVEHTGPPLPAAKQNGGRRGVPAIRCSPLGAAGAAASLRPTAGGGASTPRG